MYHHPGQQQGPPQPSSNWPGPTHHQQQANLQQQQRYPPPSHLISAMATRGSGDVDRGITDFRNEPNPNQRPQPNPGQMFSSPTSTINQQPQGSHSAMGNQAWMQAPVYDSPSPATRGSHGGGNGSGGGVDKQDSNIQRAGSILAELGLSIEDLKVLLSQYPKDQINHDNLPFILQFLKENKLKRQNNADSSSYSQSASRVIHDILPPPAHSLPNTGHLRTPEVPRLHSVPQSAGKVIDYDHHASQDSDDSRIREIMPERRRLSPAREMPERRRLSPARDMPERRRLSPAREMPERRRLSPARDMPERRRLSPAREFPPLYRPCHPDRMSPPGHSRREHSLGQDDSQTNWHNKERSPTRSISLSHSWSRSPSPPPRALEGPHPQGQYRRSYQGPRHSYHHPHQDTGSGNVLYHQHLDLEEHLNISHRIRTRIGWLAGKNVGDIFEEGVRNANGQYTYLCKLCNISIDRKAHHLRSNTHIRALKLDDAKIKKLMGGKLRDDADEKTSRKDEDQQDIKVSAANDKDNHTVPTADKEDFTPQENEKHAPGEKKKLHIKQHFNRNLTLLGENIFEEGVRNANGQYTYLCKLCNISIDRKAHHLRSNTHIRALKLDDAKIKKPMEGKLRDDADEKTRRKDEEKQDIKESPANDKDSHAVATGDGEDSTIQFYRKCDYLVDIHYNGTAIDYFCTLCEITLMNNRDLNVDYHVNGRKHKELLRVNNECIVQRPGNSKQYYCSLCKCNILNDCDVKAKHLRGIQHTTSLWSKMKHKDTASLWTKMKLHKLQDELSKDQQGIEVGEELSNAAPTQVCNPEAATKSFTMQPEEDKMNSGPKETKSSSSTAGDGEASSCKSACLELPKASPGPVTLATAAPDNYETAATDPQAMCSSDPLDTPVPQPVAATASMDSTLADDSLAASAPDTTVGSREGSTSPDLEECSSTVSAKRRMPGKQEEEAPVQKRQKTQDKPLPFDLNSVVGMECLVPKMGFFCTVCNHFFAGDQECELNHCKSLDHHKNWLKYLKSRKTTSI